MSTNIYQEKDRIFYHGSPTGGLRELKPFGSEHEEEYVYFTQNPVMALLYGVHPVEKPFRYYPYGFDQDGTVHYSEYYKNAFWDLYKGKKGYLYECAHIPSVGNPTQIRDVFVCKNPVKVDRVTMIPDLYDCFMEYQQQHRFRIRTFESMSEQEIQYVYNDLKQTIQQYNLKQLPDSQMSRFIRNHFPEVWENA